MKVTEDPHASYILIRDEMIRRGYDSSLFNLGDITAIEFTRPDRQKWMTQISRMSYPLIDGCAGKIANDKTLSYKLVERHEVPVPFTRTVLIDEEINDEEISSLVEQYSQLIVKPQQASLSHGLTLGITSSDELRAAISKAREFDSGVGSVLIQQQIHGEEIRFTMLEGKVIAALLRQTPRVVGDGVRTVAELIEAENAQRAALDDTLAQYVQLTEENVETSLLSSKKILQKGQMLELSRATMVRHGASIYNVLSQIHPSYIQLAQKCADALGAKYVVVDIFIDDYTAEYVPGAAYFNEYNVAPVLQLFYSCRDGRHADIVPQLVDAIDRRLM